MSAWVYIVASQRNGTLYIGVTSDLVRRIHEHREGIIDGFTSRHGLKLLVWFETHDDIREAIRREKALKHWLLAWKIKLIEETNPDWLDLYERLF
jgi:putative endonuclease